MTEKAKKAVQTVQVGNAPSDKENSLTSGEPLAPLVASKEETGNIEMPQQPQRKNLVPFSESFNKTANPIIANRQQAPI